MALISVNLPAEAPHAPQSFMLIYIQILNNGAALLMEDFFTKCFKMYACNRFISESMTQALVQLSFRSKEMLLQCLTGAAEPAGG